MGDGQDFLDADVETPTAADDLDDAASLTGVLAALEDPEPEAAPAEDVALQASDPEPSDPEIVALQADLEAESSTPDPAVSEAAEETESAESLDDIAPGTVVGEQEAFEYAKDIAIPNDRAGVPVWPFMVYLALWVIFAGLLIWQFLAAPAGTPIYELTIYGPSILGGLVLTALGPLVALAVWLVVWLSRPRGARAGLFSRSLIIGAVTTLAGVALWLIALGAVDMLRLGRLL